MSAAKENTDELDAPEGARTKSRSSTLSIKVDSPSACQRHITVTIPRDDIERYYDKAFSELMDTAAVPGFRAGRAPRKLVESRFRKDVTDQVKGSLLMDSMTQITEDEKFSAISEPDFDPLAVEVPDDGPMTFEFDLEVRPEFDLPEWKGLTIERPVREFTNKDVDKRLERVLAQHGRLVPFDGPAAERRLHCLQSDVQERRRGALFQQGGSDSHSPRAEFPRRQDRELRQGDEGREGRRNARGDRQADQRRPERIAARPGDHRGVRSARSQEARAARADPRVAQGAGRFRDRSANCATPCKRT